MSPARVHADRQEHRQATGRSRPEKVAETADVVATQARMAREAGAGADRGRRHRGDPQGVEPRRAGGARSSDARACRCGCCPRRTRRGCRSSGATRIAGRAAARHGRGGRRRRRVDRDRGRDGGGRRRLVGVAADRVGPAVRRLPALRPAGRRRARARAAARGGRVRGARAAARGARRSPSAAARRRCGAWSAPSCATTRSSGRSASSRPHAGRRRSRGASTSTPSACGCCPAAS